MAREIIVIRTPPGPPFFPGGPDIRIGTFEVLFLYRLLPPILDSEDNKISPTSLEELVDRVGQAFVTRWLTQAEQDSFGNGNGAWEVISGERRLLWDEGALRPETIPELIARMQAYYDIRKDDVLGDWRNEYLYQGTVIDVP